MNILKRVYNWFIKKKMSAPPPIKTISQILSDLNGENKGTWIPIDGHFAITRPIENGKMINYGMPIDGIILKAFFNQNTSEIRTYIAKFLDDPDRENLFT